MPLFSLVFKFKHRRTKKGVHDIQYMNNLCIVQTPSMLHFQHTEGILFHTVTCVYIPIVLKSCVQNRDVMIALPLVYKLEY